MIDFFIDLGISKVTVEKLADKYDENILYNLKLNELEIEKILRYFKEIGINNAEEILLFKIDVFFKTFREIKNYFIRYSDTVKLISLINEDVENINLLFQNN